MATKLRSLLHTVSMQSKVLAYLIRSNRNHCLPNADVYLEISISIIHSLLKCSKTTLQRLICKLCCFERIGIYCLPRFNTTIAIFILPFTILPQLWQIKDSPFFTPVFPQNPHSWPIPAPFTSFNAIP